MDSDEDFSICCHFALAKTIFPYFCPCHSGRNRSGQRKHILRFCLDSEPRQFTCEIRKRIRVRRLLSLLCVCFKTLHIQWSRPLFKVSFLMGSLGPTVRNKDKFGRLRSVVVFRTARLSQRAKTVSNHAKHQDKKEV